VIAVQEALRRIGADLDDLGHRWALIGGLAVTARAEPRLTRDVDVAVAVADDRAAEALVMDLRARGYGLSVALEQTATSRLSTVRLFSPARTPERVLVDLLFASSGIEPELVSAAERIPVAPGTVFPVARIGHLIALKVLARNDRSRPQDWDDLKALVAEATAKEMERAREALRLIEARGFARGKDLLAELDRFLHEIA